MSNTVYVEMPAGTAYPDGYIVPAEEIKRIPGHVYVVLRPLPPYERLSWAQWVRDEYILTDAEVSGG